MLNFAFTLLLIFSPQSDTTIVPADTVVVEQKSYTIADTTNIAEKKFSEKEINRLKAEDELNYSQPPTVAESWWTRFKQWLADLLFRILRGATTTTLGQITMYILGGALLVVIILLLLRVNAFRVFFSGADAGQSNNQLFEENIHEMDFEKLIREAKQNNDYRMATRLVFLYSLKILSDQQVIRWLPGKTNHDYLDEVERSDLKDGFQELSLYFDYAWYGNFRVSEEIFQKVEGVFLQLKNKVN
ncbi:MAG: DUF4129 domain-containing protein [Bacteroidetes bacterium]|nr:DUF4129 domain-containing protein [Bacteroidota bacterium]